MSRLTMVIAGAVVVLIGISGVLEEHVRDARRRLLVPCATELVAPRCFLGAFGKPHPRAGVRELLPWPSA